MEDFITAIKKCLTHRASRGDDILLREVFLPNRTLKELNTIGQAYYTVFDYVHFRFVYLEDTFEQITGYPSDAMLSESLGFIMAHLHPDDKLPVFKVMSRLNRYLVQMPLTNDQLPHISYCYRVKSRYGGYVRILHEWMRLIRDSHGKLMYCLERCTDISHWQSDNRVTLSINTPRGQTNLVYTPVESGRKVGLTLSERNVIRLLARGLSSKQIASEFGISFNTVNTYRRNMLKKSAVKNSAELVQLAYEQGII